MKHKKPDAVLGIAAEILYTFLFMAIGLLIIWIVWMLL
jgi:hypothetical protein